jgi:hypothetical protein
MQEDTLVASVTYGDYWGTAAADRTDDMGVHKLAERNGIDTDRYFIMGLRLSRGEVRDADDDPHVGVSILAVDTHAVKAAGLDHIQKYIDEHKRLPYVQFDVQATLKEALNCFKRFEVVLHSKFRGVEEYVRTFPDAD